MRGEFVDVGGTRVYYYAAGTRGVGDPVVLLHGFPMSSRLWHAVVRGFPDGHRLVVCDLPGFGRSDPAPTGDVGDLARIIVGLLDDLRIPKACLVGHGLGGAVAQAVAVAAPERVSRVALISSDGCGARPRRVARLARTLLPVARLAPAGFLAGLVQGSVLRGFADRERSRLSLDTCLQPFTTAQGRDVLVRHLRSLRSDETSGLTPRYAALGIPTAILWGEKDPFHPIAHAHRLHAAIPGSTLEIVSGARHFVPEDAPERVVARIETMLRSEERGEGARGEGKG